ncbi:MAG: hypothetical protein WC358_07730, partial [Ignavibacteria bacterium]
CLINVTEYEIKRIAVYHSYSRFKNFIYVEVNPEIPTGINSYMTIEYIESLIKENRFPTEEYAIFDGKIIKREEFDDGSAEINGEVIDIAGKAELRMRYLSPYNFIIAAKASSFNGDADYKISD